MGRRSYTPPRICLIYKLYTTRRVTWPATWAARGQMVRNLSVPKHGAVGLLPVSAPISVDLEIPARSVEIVAANERAPCGNGRGWPMESSSGVRWLVRDCRARRKWLPHTPPPPPTVAASAPPIIVGARCVQFSRSHRFGDWPIRRTRPACRNAMAHAQARFAPVNIPPRNGGPGGRIASGEGDGPAVRMALLEELAGACGKAPC